MKIGHGKCFNLKPFFFYALLALIKTDNNSGK